MRRLAWLAAAAVAGLIALGARAGAEMAESAMEYWE